MAALWLLVAVLAAWRLTSLIARERGPFAVGTRLRSLFGVHHGPDGKPAYGDDDELLLNPVTRFALVDSFLHEIALGMTCTWCCSVWVSLGVALLLRAVAPVLVTDLPSYLLIVLAISASVIAFDSTLVT